MLDFIRSLPSGCCHALQLWSTCRYTNVVRLWEADDAGLIVPCAEFCLALPATGRTAASAGLRLYASLPKLLASGEEVSFGESWFALSL